MVVLVKLRAAKIADKSVWWWRSGFLGEGEKKIEGHETESVFLKFEVQTFFNCGGKVGFTVVVEVR